VSKKLKRCIEITRSLKPEMQSGKNFHCSFIFDGARLLSIGFNSYKHGHLAHKFGEYPPTRGGTNYKPCRHSETECLNRLKKVPNNFTMINTRINNQGEIAMARPCPNCEKVLREKKFKKLLYTINDKEYGILT